MGTEEAAQSGIWEAEEGDRADITEVMRVQGDRIDRRERVYRPHTYVYSDTAKVCGFHGDGVSEGEKLDDSGSSVEFVGMKRS
jgi:hypothetical protein